MFFLWYFHTIQSRTKNNWIKIKLQPWDRSWWNLRVPQSMMRWSESRKYPHFFFASPSLFFRHGQKLCDNEMSIPTSFSVYLYSPRNRVKVGGGVEKETGRRWCYLQVELLLRWWWKSRRSIWEDGLNWEGNLLEAGGVESRCAGYQVLLLLLAADLGCTRWCRPGTVQLEPRV